MKKTFIITCALIISTYAFAQTTWYEIPTGTNKNLNSITFPSNNVGYIAGNDSLILKTTDGGQTWVELGLNGIQLNTGDENFYDVHFVDENNGFIVCGYSGTYQTSDGGQTWTIVGGQTSNMWLRSAVYPFSATDFFIGGSGFFEGAMMDHFQNGTWISSVSSYLWQEQYLQEFSFANPNLGLGATKGTYMVRTIDAGVTWDTIPTGITGFLTSVVMVNDTLCYAGYDESGSGFGILKSIDGGLTWEQDINSATFYYPTYLCVHAAQNGDIYSGAVPSISPGGLIFESEDVINWQYYNVDQPINDLTSYGSDITFAVGDSGYLVVNAPMADLGIPDDYTIDFNVFPNPVLNELTIQNPNSETMEVMILDAAGRILKEDFAQSGLNTIDCSNLNTGLYFVNVKIGTKSGIQQLVKL